jgi:hypothetical protein
MSEPNKKPRGSGCLLWGVALMLPVLYVLSIGPVAWLAGQYPAIEEFAQLVYFPLVIAAKTFPPVENALKWYLDFWQ